MGLVMIRKGRNVVKQNKTQQQNKLSASVGRIRLF